MKIKIYLIKIISDSWYQFLHTDHKNTEKHTYKGKDKSKTLIHDTVV